jgi:hypothetical protein
MSRPSDSIAHAYEPEPYPILEAWPEFWWMSESDRSSVIETRALAYGGQGYQYHPDLAEAQSRARERMR